MQSLPIINNVVSLNSVQARWFCTFQPRNPTGPLEMKSYLGSISDETEHEDLMSKLKPCFKCKAEKTIDSNNTSCLGHDRMVVGFITTYAIITHHQ
jgi:hypothetical protein